MTHEQITKALSLRGRHIPLQGHDGKGTDVRTSEFRVVIVMMVVRASPNTAGTENKNAKYSHQALGQPGVGQDRMMLLIVVNYKKTENEQPREQAANNPPGKIEVPESPRNGTRQQKRGRENAPPTPDRRIRRVGFGCEYQFFTSAHAFWAVKRSPIFAICPQETSKGRHYPISSDLFCQRAKTSLGSLEQPIGHASQTLIDRLHPWRLERQTF